MSTTLPLEGINRVDLQRHDLSIPGHEVIQNRVEIGPETPARQAQASRREDHRQGVEDLQRRRSVASSTRNGPGREERRQQQCGGVRHVCCRKGEAVPRGSRGCKDGARTPSCRSRKHTHAHCAVESAPAQRIQWRGQDSNLRRLSQRVYSAPPLTAREPRRDRSSLTIGDRRRQQWPISIDLVVSVLRAPEEQTCAGFHCLCWGEPASPIPDQDEQAVAARSAEALDDAVPAPVAASCTDSDGPPVL
jgi:hypothetical protein